MQDASGFQVCSVNFERPAVRCRLPVHKMRNEREKLNGGAESMNIPNMISLVRILLTPVFAVLYVRGALYQAMGVLLLCAVSDVLDGAIARRFNMVTDLGKALDPAADKLIQIAMMLCAATRTKAAWLLLALHIVRELSLASLGARVLQCTGKVYSTRW